MEVKTWDVILVSAFGRADWLATELRSLGLTVFLVDVTSQLGNWPAEDIEGPCGFFMLEKYEQSFLEQVSHLDTFVPLESGFTVWTDAGPLEMKAPLTAYRFSRLGLHPKMWEILNSLSLSSTSYRHSEGDFSQIWPLSLAHQLASTTYLPNRRAHEEGEALPLLANFSTRNSTRGGFDRSLKWVTSKDVKLTQNSQILDVALAGRRHLTALELKGEPSGLFRFDHLVWTLSSEETYFLNERLGKKLFPQGVIESTWSWMRFRMKIGDCMEVQILPQHVCLMDDVMAPWTHENLCVLQKTTLAENIDAWIRLPSVQRFNKEYLKEMGDRISRRLRKKMPQSAASVLSYPQEYYYTYEDLGAPRFPLFLKEDESSRRYSFFQNFHRDGLEIWPNFSRESQYRVQSQLRDRIAKTWHQAQLKKKEKELNP